MVTGGQDGEECHPAAKKYAKNRGKEVEHRRKEGKNWTKEGTLGRKGKNREGSFTLPLLTDRDGYAVC